MSGALRVSALTIFSLAVGQAAELKKETLNAWDSYLAQESAQVKERAAKGGGFFWTDADPKRREQVKAGGVLVEAVGEQNPLHVPGGLIHHWIGAVFIPGARIEDVLAIARDYPHYKDYYKPGVGDAATLFQSDSKDEFTIRFVNPSVLSKSSLEGKYVSEFVRVSADRFYSTSVTTSMREIRDFGCANEKDLPSGEGSGYIWRLYSTARMENRDGGVLLEMEAVALSRDIPACLHWFVDPIVRRISRDSIEKSLTQTSVAVRERLDSCEARNRIIGQGNCSTHADSSDFRAERLAGDAGR